MSHAVSLALLTDRELASLRAEVLGRLAEQAGPEGPVLPEGPAAWTIHGRAAEPVRFGEDTLAFAGGPATSVLDEPGGRVRRLTASDVAAFCRLADALPEMAAVEPPLPVRASMPEKQLPGDTETILTALAVAFAATGKHLLVSVSGAGQARAAVEMAAAVAGGPDALRERPLLTAVVAPDDGGRQSATPVVSAGLPLLAEVELSPVGASDRDAFVAALAGGLALTAAVQAAVPEAPAGVLMTARGGAGSDAGHLALTAAAAQVVRSFGLPCVTRLSAGSAVGSDWAASADTTAAALTGWLAGVDAVAGAGLVAGGSTVSFVGLALAAEIASYAAATQAGIPVDEETLAVEVIEQVGIAGNYLGEKHTRRHMRDVWRPRFFDRVPYEQWVREGRRESPDLAAEWVDRTLKEQTAPPLDPAVVAELERVVDHCAKTTAGASRSAASRDAASVEATPRPPQQPPS